MVIKCRNTIRRVNEGFLQVYNFKIGTVVLKRPLSELLFKLKFCFKRHGKTIYSRYHPDN